MALEASQRRTGPTRLQLKDGVIANVALVIVVSSNLPRIRQTRYFVPFPRQQLRRPPVASLLTAPSG